MGLLVLNSDHMPGRVHKIVLLLFTVLLMNGPAMGQPSGIDTPITLHADALPLRDILDLLEEQSGLIFSYSSRLFDDEQVMTIFVDEGSLKGVLDLIFSGLRVRYEVVEQQIVLKRARRMKVEVEASIKPSEMNVMPVRFTLSGYVKDLLTGEVLIGATVTIPGGL